MSIIKCKMCGAPFGSELTASTCTCEYCGTVQTVPKFADNEKINQLFERANRYRMENEFDKASGIYETIISEAPNEPEAYWGICLCSYGIEYVIDPKSEKRVPTCHRTSYKSIFSDSNYLAAMEKADSEARKVYASEAQYIDTIQKKIIEVSSKEEPYDIFICYKETDSYGNRTKDSVIAQDIYNALTEKGYKVFFSRITLKDKIGTAYEPYIFSALNSAKAMLVIGSNPEYFNAVWVKNEWSRYLSLIEQGQKKILVPCYRDMTPKDFPPEFAALQAQDVSQLGYLQDLSSGIEKCIGPANTIQRDILMSSANNNQLSSYSQSVEVTYNMTDKSPRYVGLISAVKLFFRNYANFKSRSTRSEYWLSVLFFFIAVIVMEIIGEAIDTDIDAFLGLFAFIYMIPSLSVTIRRLHDCDKSGWYILFGCIPLFGWLIVMVWMCQQSYPIANRWGNPANPNNL